MNALRTKSMATSRNANIRMELLVDNVQIEQGRSFKYLGTLKIVGIRKKE